MEDQWRITFSRTAHHLPPDTQMSGYLKKWTNYRNRYRWRFFVLSQGILFYYKDASETSGACRGYIPMRIATVKVEEGKSKRFQILGKGSVRYSLQARDKSDKSAWVNAITKEIEKTRDSSISEGPHSLNREPAYTTTNGAAYETVDNSMKEENIPLISRAATVLEDSGDEEFFDAIQDGELQVEEPTLVQETEAVSLSTPETETSVPREFLLSYKGYEDPPRKKLNIPDDERPKISLWGILKSVIGQDMTRMALPVTINEPTSLLYRVAEDMEYADILNFASLQEKSVDRLLYVAAFACSEYASTIGRVAKPFNPLLHETYEYVRPDKNYRFFVEQVSHHPPVAACFADSPKWTYYGESSVKAKFTGRTFDIHPLGTWYLKMIAPDGSEEVYTWKKVTSQVVGILTGNPVVDNYGTMEVRNWSTNEICRLDMKARGWRGANAFEVKGKVFDDTGLPAWTIDGRWNDKIYARPVTAINSSTVRVVFEAHERKPAPFNLTEFAISLNGLPDRLKPYLPPTDSRLRPDQRAMEEAKYDVAASEKQRLEEKQRATRKQREAKSLGQGDPLWFSKEVHPITKEPYWKFNGNYWDTRAKAVEVIEAGKPNTSVWAACPEIF